ncbi:MAG: hypothetical protein R2909_22435 [Gemmatimonadales bacterium]
MIATRPEVDLDVLVMLAKGEWRPGVTREGLIREMDSLPANLPGSAEQLLATDRSSGRSESHFRVRPDVVL